MGRSYFSLILAQLLRYVRHDSLKVLKPIDITIFHILVLDILITRLKLPLNIMHFLLNFNFILDGQLLFQLLGHISWILTL